MADVDRNYVGMGLVCGVHIEHMDTLRVAPARDIGDIRMLTGTTGEQNERAQQEQREGVRFGQILCYIFAYVFVCE